MALSILHKDLTDHNIASAIEVHRHLGPGLLESVYERCLCHEFGLRKIGYRAQVRVPLDYKGITLDADYRADLVVEDRVVVEVKAVESLLRVHEAQLLSYLRLLNYEVGLLINLHEAVLKDGIVRRALSRT